MTLEEFREGIEREKNRREQDKKNREAAGTRDAESYFFVRYWKKFKRYNSQKHK